MSGVRPSTVVEVKMVLMGMTTRWEVINNLALVVVVAVAVVVAVVVPKFTANKAISMASADSF